MTTKKKKDKTHHTQMIWVDDTFVHTHTQNLMY